MIKCCTERGSLNLEVHGDVTEILADLNLIVSEIYKEIHGECARDYFKAVFESGMFSHLAFSSAEELRTEVEEQKKRNADAKESLKSMVDDLEALAKAIKNL